MSERSERFYRFGPYRLDVEECRLVRGAEPVLLSPKAFDTLVALVRHGGRLVGKDELIKEVWPETFVEESNLVHQISSLRKALGETEDGQHYVETVPRRGYRFAALVTEEGEEQPPAASPRLRWVVAGAAILALGVVGYLGRDRLGSAAPEPDDRVMLAVLPFDNLSGDREQEYFSDGLTEEMITQLGQLSPERLGVIARTSSMRYKGDKKSVDEISRELGVDYILEGSVRRSGDRVRVSAQLIQVSDQTHLWAESYDRGLRDVLALQAEVAASIARMIRIQLPPTASARLARARPIPVGAYEAYLRGLYYYHHWFTEKGFHKAIENFREAVKTDPSYALAHAALAAAIWESGHDFGDLPPEEAAVSAKEAVRKALELDPQLPEGHYVLGHVLWEYDWDWNAAERELQAALALNQSLARARVLYAHFLIAMGRSAEAVEMVEHAASLDPGNPLISTNASKPALYSRQFAKALDILGKVEEMHPDFAELHRHLGMCYRGMGLYDQAIAHFQKAVAESANHPFQLAVLGQAYGLAGRTGEARAILGQIEKLSERRYIAPTIRARVYAGLGENDLAFAWIDNAVEQRDTTVVRLGIHPDWDPIRSDSRFQNVLRRVGLPQAAPSAPGS